MGQSFPLGLLPPYRLQVVLGVPPSITLIEYSRLIPGLVLSAAWTARPQASTCTE